MPVKNLISLWNNMSVNRRIVVIGATVAMFLAVASLSRMASTPGMALLYAGLDSSTAGEVVRALEQRGVAYEVSGDSIRVDETQRDVLRMTLAAEGLPATGAAGYELLDGLSGFGTTSQMFDAAYWRAKEGELARTIISAPTIRAARVHLAQMPSQPFQKDRRPTASVTVTSSTGSFSAQQANTLRHLISSSVPGMRPEDVAVIDTVAGLIPSSDQGASPAMGGNARAQELKQNIERLLAARVGPGHAVVEVTVDVETQRESVVQRTFDPQGRVAISSDTTDRKNSSTQSDGQVTVASNLPQGNANAGGQGRSNGSETNEKINYEVSETKREILRAPGALLRITVAVLIDGQSVTAADGTISQQPRDENELSVLRELVSSAAGLKPERGDVLTLKSLPFQSVAEAGTLAEKGLLATLGPINGMTLIQTGVLALVTLILGLFVIRPLVRSGSGSLGAEVAALPAMPDGSDDVGSGLDKNTPRVLTGEIDDIEIPGFPMVAFNSDEMEAGDSEPMQRLRRLIEERQVESLEILRGWMETDEEEKV